MKSHVYKLQLWVLAMLASLLVACGGGSDSTVQLTGVSSDTLALSPSSLTVSNASPGTITATVRDTSGNPVAGMAVHFSTQLGNFGPGVTSTTVTTGLSGTASVTLYAGSVAGNGAVIVSFTDAQGNSRSGSVGFTTAGDQVASSSSSSGGTSSSGSSSGSTSGATLTMAITDTATGAVINPATATLSGTTTWTITATLADSANPAATQDQVVTFTSVVGSLNPSSGTVLTDNTGKATIIISAGTVQGAGPLNAKVSSNALGTVSAPTVNIQSLGNGSSTSTSLGYKMTLQLENQTGTAQITSVTGASPGLLVATLTDASTGLAVPNAVVSFTTTIGAINPASGTALTNSSGVATVNLNAGSVGGAGTVTATYASTTSASVSFSTDGSGTSTVSQPTMTVLGFVNGSGTPISTDTVTNAAPVTLAVQIKDANGNNLPNQVVTFTNATPTVPVVLTPSSGTALTDSNGLAEVNIAVGTASGAGTIKATTTVGSTALSGSFNFLAQQDTPAMGTGSGSSFVSGALQVSQTTLSQGSTMAITANVVDVTAGNTLISTTPVTVSFTTTCANSTIDQSVITQSGTATATYTAGSACSSDLITATASVFGQTITARVTLSVAAAGAAAIDFVSASPSVIAIFGTGGASGIPQTSSVVFKVVDTQGNPVPNTQVDFGLSTTLGGIALTNSGSPASTASGQTNSLGEVTAIVQSGTVATPVRVTAVLHSNTNISAVSSALSVSTGLPSQNHFTISASSNNPRGGDMDGSIVTVKAIASDEFGNPVPDGTAIQFYSEIGQIDPQCQTTGGICTVNWTSSGNRTATVETNRVTDMTTTVNGLTIPYMDNAATSLSGLPNQINADINDRVARSTIVAFAIGEESYQDLNGNGVYDVGEPVYAHLPEAFDDYGEEGVYDPNIVHVGKFVDFDMNGIYTQADSFYHGLLCSAAATSAGNCASLGDVRSSTVIDMASDNPHFYIFGANVSFTDPTTNLPANWVDTVTSGVPTNLDSTELLNFADVEDTTKYVMLNSSANGLNNQVVGVIYHLSTTNSSLPLRVYVTDQNGNALIQGTKITINGGGAYTGVGSCTVPSSTEAGVCDMTLSPVTGASQFTDVVITVTTPAATFTQDLPVTIN